MFVAMSECHTVSQVSLPQWSAPTDVVADMAGPPVMMVQRYPVGKVLSPASMTSGKNNSRHHHNISFRLRIPKFLWPWMSAQDPEDWQRRMLDSGLWLSRHCVLCEYFRADNGPEIGMKPPFLTAIWRRICDNSMKQRDWGTHVAIGQGETQRPDRFGEGGTNNISRQNSLMYVTTVGTNNSIKEGPFDFGSGRSSRSHNLLVSVQLLKFV